MFEREAKREKNLEKRAVELARRARATESETKSAERKADGKDEKVCTLFVPRVGAWN